MVDKKYTTLTFIDKAKQIHFDKYDYSLTEYKGIKTPIKIICKICNKYFLQRPDHHLYGSGCPDCSRKIQANKHKLTQEEFINKAKNIHGDLYDYSKTIYNKHRNKIEIICKKCNKSFWQSANAHLNGEGCPNCVNSKGESKIKLLLNAWNIKYVFQKRFKDCIDKQALSFDFYLPDYNSCIEFQGEQHFSPQMQINLMKDKKKGLRRFNIQKKHDKIKRLYCKQNNIYLIEIKYDENIEDKLKAELFKNV